MTKMCVCRLLIISDQYATPLSSHSTSRHTHTHTHVSFPTTLISCQRTLCFLERSLHLFSRCGDGSCWKSLFAAFTRDPLGQPRYSAAALIASCCAVLFADFHLPAHTLIWKEILEEYAVYRTCGNGCGYRIIFDLITLQL